MATVSDNEVLTRVAPGTLLGNLLSDVAHLLDRPHGGLSLAQEVNALLGLIGNL